MQGCNPRQSSVRVKTLANLKGVEQALKVYTEQHGIIPDELSVLVKEGLLAEEMITEFVVVPTPKGNVIKAKKPFGAVKKGEAWGDLGDVAEKDIPSVIAVILPGKKAVVMPESEFRQAMEAYTRAE